MRFHTLLLSLGSGLILVLLLLLAGGMAPDSLARDRLDPEVRWTRFWKVHRDTVQTPLPVLPSLLRSGVPLEMLFPAGLPLSEMARQLADSLDSAGAEVLATRDLGTGQASFYAHEFAGRRTASGERFNPEALTAAHRTLPMGTRVRVTNLRNGQSVIVRITDRGPFKKGRIIDLSLAAARVIGMVRSGIAPVKLEIVQTRTAARR